MTTRGSSEPGATEPGPSGLMLVTRALAFACDRHTDDRRKGARAEPYVNHLADVAELVARASETDDPVLVAAALLHDVIEDTPTKYDELVERFGGDVADLVMECTDDKEKTRTERKRLQVVNAPKKSPRAKMIKLADKTANLWALAKSPPRDWSMERRLAYLDWARQVAAGLRGVSGELEAAFDQAADAAERALKAAPERETA